MIDCFLKSNICFCPVGNRTISRDQLIEAEDDLNSALDEALETYDLATSWMEGDGEKEVVRK
jgi:hypothetical protein